MTNSKCRVGLVLFSSQTVHVDSSSKEGDICEIREFHDSVIYNDELVIQSNDLPRDYVLLVDNRPQANALHSVFKGAFGQIDIVSLSYSREGIFGLFLLKSEERHHLFPQNWAFVYTIRKKRVVVKSNPILGLEIQTYKE